MTLKPLVEKKEIKEALDLFVKQMNKGTAQLTSTLGWKGGNIETEVSWNKSLGIWSISNPEELDNRYWYVFGIQDPSKYSTLNITCEINFPKEDINRRVAGLFVRDNSGNIFITHSGNLRGGRKGVGRSQFTTFIQRDQFVDITLEDGVEFENILIGRLGDTELPDQVNNFVKKVNLFKEKVVSNMLPEITNQDLKKFSPEFSGQRESYSKTDIIKSMCNHGLVVESLHDLVESRGMRSTNDNLRDLFIYDDAGLMTVLFEVKTDLSTSSIYSAIGQLMYYSASQDPVPKLVMVLPSKPTRDTKKILDRLKIEVLQYKLEKGDMHFFGFDDLLKR